MNLARLFSSYRLLERQAARERARHRAEVFRLRAELKEWQNKFLGKVNATPLGYTPPKSEPVERPPIGPTAKRNMLAEQRKSEVHGGGEAPSAEEIVEAARLADMRANSNGHG